MCRINNTGTGFDAAGKYLQQTENVFNSSRHQRQVTIVFGAVYNFLTYLLTYLLTGKGITWLKWLTFSFNVKRRSYESEERGVEHDRTVGVERHVH